MLFLDETDGGGVTMWKCLCVIAAISVPAAGSAQTTKYTYDALGRLKTSETTVNGSPVTTNISYDKAGNRTGYKVEGGSSAGSDPGAGASAPTTRRFVVVPLNGFTLIPIG